MIQETAIPTPTDREVGNRLATLFGFDFLTERTFTWHVIPALEARGLGPEYICELEKLAIPPRVPWYARREISWLTHKAPLSLRARAALSVLEEK